MAFRIRHHNHYRRIGEGRKKALHALAWACRSQAKGGESQMPLFSSPLNASSPEGGARCC